MIAASTTGTFGFAGSTGEIAVEVVFAIVFALLGYRISSRHRALRGVTPWGLPSIAWAVICLVFQPIGIIIELFAELTTRPGGAIGRSPERGRNPAAFRSGPVPDGMPPERDATPIDQGQVDHDVVASGPAPTPAHAPPAGDGSGATPLFGWYPDATGRHELRFWDGKSWTDHVANDGVRATDEVHPAVSGTSVEEPESPSQSPG